jgi:hypothetical protein
MKQLNQRGFTILLTMAMVLGYLVLPLSDSTAEAASKLKVTCSQKTIAVNCSTTIKTNVKAKFASSNKKIATVSSKGVVKGKKAGKVKITVTSKSNKKQKKTVTITVKNQLVITAPEKSSVNLYVGDTVKIKTNLSSKYTSSDTKVATVNSSGIVTAKSAGTAKITVTAKSDKKLKKTVTITVQAKPAPTTEQPTTESTITPNPGPTTETPTVEQPSTEKATTEQPSTTEGTTTEQPSTQEPTIVGIEAKYRGDKVPNDVLLINIDGADVNVVYSDGSKAKADLDYDNQNYTFKLVEQLNGFATYKVEYEGFSTTFTVELVDTEELYLYQLGALYNGEALNKGELPALDDITATLIMSDINTTFDADKSKLKIIPWYDSADRKIFHYVLVYDYTFNDENGNELFVCRFASIDVPYK